MDLPIAATLAVFMLIVGVGVGVAVMGYRAHVGDLQRRLAEQTKDAADAQAKLVEQEALMNSPKWRDWLKLKHKQEAADMTNLLVLTATDNLDALGRMSPEHLRQVIDQFTAHRAGRNGKDSK